MRIGKNKNNKSVKSMTLVLALALVLVFGCAVGGTLAWLMDTTDTVTNTFSVGNIDIDLAETVKDGFKILPGTNQKKDPVVTVKAGSEDCWVFVQVQEKNNSAAIDGSGVITHKYVTWEIDDTVWTKLNENNGVITYYAKNKYTTEAEGSYNVLKNKEVSYGDSLTKEMIDKLYDNNGTIKTELQPQLIFKAFAVQDEAGISAAAAWEKVSPTEYLGYVPSTP